MHLAAVSAPGRLAGPRPAISIRIPRREDGARVWELVAESGGLDANSLYCNLLQCSHFAETCAIAEAGGDIIGWVSGYIPPGAPDTYFVWQVCTAESARGQGLARRLIASVLARPCCAGVTRLQSTITAANTASWALFGGVAAALGAPMTHAPHFTREAHFAGRHDTEHLVSIGPFARRAA